MRTGLSTRAALVVERWTTVSLDTLILVTRLQIGTKGVFASLSHRSVFHSTTVRSKAGSSNTVILSLFLNSEIAEHGITGEILVHLDHEALKDIGIHSVGQRLAILKQVYLLKLQHNVPVEDGHYVPPSDDLEDSNPFETAIGPTASKHLRELISERDDRIRNLESEVQRLYDSVVTLQSEFLVRPSNAKVRTFFLCVRTAL